MSTTAPSTYYQTNESVESLIGRMYAIDEKRQVGCELAVKLGLNKQ